MLPGLSPALSSRPGMPAPLLWSDYPKLCNSLRVDLSDNHLRQYNRRCKMAQRPDETAHWLEDLSAAIEELGRDARLIPTDNSSASDAYLVDTVEIRPGLVVHAFIQRASRFVFHVKIARP